VNSPRQVDLHGSISARDAAGRTIRVDCAGAHVTIDAESARAAVSALSGLRALHATVSSDALEPLALGRLDDIGIDLCVRGHRVGRAGQGARASWLGRALTHMPVELHVAALLRAVMRVP
jgi:hypothetical protein